MKACHGNERRNSDDGDYDSSRRKDIRLWPVSGSRRNFAIALPREELEVLIRARYPIIYLVSWEEERAEQYLHEIAERRKKKLFVWTLTQGLIKHGSEPQRSKGSAGSTTDPLAALDAVLDNVE